MSDRIQLQAMEFEGRHGVGDEERSEPQLIEVDVEMRLDLRAAGTADDLDQTVDYGAAFERCRLIVEARSFHLLEGIAEAVASDLLSQFGRVESVLVRVRKPGVPIDGVLEYAGVEIERSRVAG
jgi:7,8-dihydroneopterin aldolase/epimerase/oxygenase